MLCGQVVCDFCRDHLEVNQEAFADPRLELIIDDAKVQLEVRYLTLVPVATANPRVPGCMHMAA